MATYTQILYQIVFSTKNRDNCLVKENREQLFKYIWGITKNKKCILYRINGVENHIHLITHLHPCIALADFVREIKTSSSVWIKENDIFQGFKSWQIGYAAFTYSIKSKENLIKYVKNQEVHHQKKSFIEELKDLLKEHKVSYDPKYLL